MKITLGLPLLVLVPLLGCTLAKVDVNVVGERTALENQVIGTANSLDREMLAVASVRGVDPSGRFREPPARSGDARDATAALQVIEFNSDDLAAFKKLGWVGEANNGYLKQFPMAGTPPDDLKDFAARYSQAEFDSVVAKVNEARKTVMARVIMLNESFTMKDMPAVESIFGKLNTGAALKGEKIQLADGRWTVKE